MAYVIIIPEETAIREVSIKLTARKRVRLFLAVVIRDEFWRKYCLNGVLKMTPVRGRGGRVAGGEHWPLFRRTSVVYLR